MPAWWNELRLQLLRRNTMLPKYFCLGEHAFSPDKGRDSAYWTFPRFMMPHVYRLQSWLVPKLMSLEIMRLSAYEIFSIYSCCPRETRQLGEGYTCCVLLSVLPQSNWGVCVDWFLCLCLSCTGEGSGMYRGWTFLTFQGTCFVGSSLLLPPCFFYYCIFTLLDTIPSFTWEKTGWNTPAEVGHVLLAFNKHRASEGSLRICWYSRALYVWGFFKLQYRCYKCGYTIKGTEVTPFKDTVSCPSGGPKFMNIAMCSSFIFSQLSLKPFPPALWTQPATAQW